MHHRDLEAAPLSPGLEARARSIARRPLVRVQFVAAAAMAAVAAFVILWATFHDGGVPIDDLAPPIRYAVVRASSDGDVIIPGVERDLLAPSPVHRNGSEPPSDSLAMALASLAKRYNRSSDPDVARWLVAGYLSSGQVERARTIADVALLRHPDDRGVRHLAALVSFRRGDGASSQDQLIDLAAATGGDAVTLYNLAAVSHALGDTLAYADALDDLARRSPSLHRRALTHFAR